MRVQARERPLWLACAAIVALCFAQSPGLVAADTKLDLTGNPVGFLRQAWSLWSDVAPLGQPRNQAYGYLFPHGSFFALGSLAHIPPWVVQRCWWSVLLCVGFVGMVRLGEVLGIGAPASRMIAASAYLASPRVMTTLGAISSETAPMMLAPWVLIPVVQAWTSKDPSMRRLAARSAGAVALMGAVNAVATAAACLPAFLWWAAHAPRRRGPNPRWRSFTAWWIPCLALACAWWATALLLLGSVSPPFLDFIESSRVTTRWTSLVEVVRGADGWTGFVDPSRMASTGLVSYPVLVFATGALAAVGLAGLCLQRTPHRGLLAAILLVGVLGICVGYAGPLGGPFAEPVRVFLDAAGAPLRNVHKLDPLVRMPLALGVASALGALSAGGQGASARGFFAALARPERGRAAPVAIAVLMAVALSASASWTGRLAPGKPYQDLPGYWRSASAWLGAHLATEPHGARVLVAPGAPWADQVWGLTRDEPIQALADFPWAVRDAIPLTPPGAIRSLDAVQRLFADGRPSSGLADMLLEQGFAYLVLRNDLDLESSHSTRPILAHQTVEGSPGLQKVAEFGPLTGAGQIPGAVVDDDLRARYPAVEIYRVAGGGHSEPPGPYLVGLDGTTVVDGGAEALLPIIEHAHELGDPEPGPILLRADARRAGLAPKAVVVTDTPALRGTDYGRVDDHVSAVQAEGDPKRVANTVTDYPTEGAAMVRGVWEGARVAVSSSVSEANGLSIVSPGNSPRAAFDGDPSTSWLSAGLEHAVGQWLQLDFDTPVSDPQVTVTVSRAIGPAVDQLEVATERGTATLRDIVTDRPTDVTAPTGQTHWLRITATGTANGTAGNQFGISELQVFDGKTGKAVPVRFKVLVPDAGPDTLVRQWELGQEFPGRAGCAKGPVQTQCTQSLTLAPEEPTVFSRTIGVARATDVLPALFVRSRLSPASTDLLAEPGRVLATGESANGDSRGSAYAAVDGDPRTAWTASPNALKPGAPKPRLTLQLPVPADVAQVRLVLPAGALPARPTKIAVDLGDGRQVRDIDPDQDSVVVDLHPHRTDHVVITVLAWQDALNVNSLGFAELQPPGFAEVELLGPDGGAAPGFKPLDEDRTVTVDCEHGPVLTIGDRTVPTSVTATVGALRSGAVVRATPCDFNPVPLGPGPHDIAAAPGNAFVVDSLVLRDVGLPPPHAPDPQQADVRSWDVDARDIAVRQSAEPRILVVPESVNPGWRAAANGHDGAGAEIVGKALQPVTVNGWQQGWIVPAGFEGAVQLRFPLNTWYRAGLVAGLAGLVPLAALAIAPAAPRRRDPQPLASTPSARLSGALAGLACAWLITGLAGAAAALALGLGSWRFARRGGCLPRAAAIVGGLSMTAAAGLLALGPWRSASYLGGAAVPQLLTLIALGSVVCSAVFDREGEGPRSSREPQSREHGASTQE
ncbi:MAG: alpha-(1-_3)-arabinofuranosyltransferase domain-containing protein [Segniliparus sp.]|uniref:alpha-(1->3)-arabinofuranosyltransferase domain-containing protein n=1 Tax=Segniliparus sp. TaxID=2804064 RepID=UPI003F319B6A